MAQVNILLLKDQILCYFMRCQYQGKNVNMFWRDNDWENENFRH